MNGSRRRFLSLLGLSLLCLDACRSTQVRSAPTTIRVMTYNIHHGRGLDGRIDLDRIAELIRAERADIVALNEVDRGTERTHRRDIAAELGKRCGMHHVFYKNIDFRGGEYGNALLSRFAIREHTNRHYQMLRKHEQRGLLQTTMRVGDHDLRVWVTHIDHRRDDSERLFCVEQIQGWLADAPGAPVILCGDFNDTPGSPTLDRVTSTFVDSWAMLHNADGFTYAADGPRKRIDYVFLQRGSGLRPTAARVPRSKASDHLPLVVEIAIDK